MALLLAVPLSTLAMVGIIHEASAGWFDRSIARYDAIPCWFEVDGARKVSCGELAVPENWEHPRGRKIHLPVVVFESPSFWSSREPIIFLSGGPGGRADIRNSAGIERWLTFLEYQSWTDNHDFIVFAQRGTNWDDSDLSCPGLASATLEDVAALTACARSLAAEHDLSAYNSDQSATDVMALSEALDLSSWSILAVSYGTRFAMKVMPALPQGLRAVILDSPYPPELADRERRCAAGTNQRRHRRLWADGALRQDVPRSEQAL